MTNTPTSGPWPDTVPSTMHPGYVWYMRIPDTVGDWRVYNLSKPSSYPILKVFYTNKVIYDHVSIAKIESGMGILVLSMIPVEDAPPLKDFLHLAEMMYITTTK